MKVTFGRPLPRKKKLIILLLIASVWSLATLGVLSLGILPIFVYAVYMAARDRNVLPFAVILISPLTGAFILGIAAWHKPRPSFNGHGLPAPSAFNLEPSSRIWPGVGGCVIRGGEWIADEPYNLALRLTSKLRGPPPQTYHGAYPSTNEVNLLTQGIPETPPHKFFNGILLAGTNQFKIGTNYAQYICRDLGQDTWDVEEILGRGRVRATTLNNECLIVRMSSESDYFGNEKARDGAMLIDLKTMRPFARYSTPALSPRNPSYAFRFEDTYQK